MIKSIIAPLLISIYGDSTIQGVEVINGQGFITKNTAPVMLQRWYGDRAVVSSNARIGSTIKDLINGTGYFTEPFAEAIKKDTGQIIIENFAINDSILYDQQSYEVYLQYFIGIVRANGKVPILEEPNPICFSATWAKNLRAFTYSINKIANANNVLVIHQYQHISKDVPKWQLMLGDCIHPNSDDLYSLKAHLEYLTLEANL